MSPPGRVPAAWPPRVPLLTKGRSQNDTPANVNANYFLGINTNGTAGNLTDDRLAVDFEDTATGLNHPFTATTVVGVSSVWHHAAATYDGSVWRVYLDGVLDGTSTPQAATPESGSIQHASLGTAMNSTGVAAGFFAGQLDEARIWSTARSGAQIASSMNTEITTPAAGLLGRWGLNDGTGTTASNSAGSPNGTIVAAPPWVDGFTESLNRALQFNGTSQYVTFGAAPSLATTTMTLEVWFKRTAEGIATSTGSGGLTSAVPLLTKGRSQDDIAANQRQLLPGDQHERHRGQPHRRPAWRRLRR